MNKIRIICMDDHPIVRMGLTAALNSELDILVVAEGDKAQDVLRLVEEHKPDVVLFDIQMDQSTFGFVSRIQEVEPKTRVLFISAFDSSENAEQVSRVGGAGLVSKQDGRAVISAAIRRVAAGGTYFSKKIHSSGSEAQPIAEHPLSPREIDVLCCVAHAMTAKEIALNLAISVKTVDRHKANIMQKLNVRSQSDLVRYAIRNRFVSL